MGGAKNMENLQIDKKTKQIRLDASFHKKLKILASQKGMSIKALIELELESLVNEVKI